MDFKNYPIKELNGYTIAQVFNSVLRRRNATLSRILNHVRPVSVSYPGLRQVQAQNYLEISWHDVWGAVNKNKWTSEKISRFCARDEREAARLSPKALVLLAVANYGKSEVCDQITKLFVGQLMKRPQGKVNCSKVAVHKAEKGEKSAQVVKAKSLPAANETVKLPLSDPIPVQAKIKCELPEAMPVSSHLLDVPEQSYEKDEVILTIKPGMVLRVVAM
ncbi:MAG: hypothetical protein IJV14_10710 [Lachnospiraceae bacterium]|nr:hypothetical protein [Lachnospiraceae bacterium]